MDADETAPARDPARARPRASPRPPNAPDPELELELEDEDWDRRVADWTAGRRTAARPAPTDSAPVPASYQPDPEVYEPPTLGDESPRKRRFALRLPPRAKGAAAESTPIESTPIESTSTESARTESASTESAPTESASTESAPTESASTGSAAVADGATNGRALPTSRSRPVAPKPRHAAVIGQPALQGVKTWTPDPVPAHAPEPVDDKVQDDKVQTAVADEASTAPRFGGFTKRLRGLRADDDDDEAPFFPPEPQPAPSSEPASSVELAAAAPARPRPRPAPQRTSEPPVEVHASAEPVSEPAPVPEAAPPVATSETPTRPRPRNRPAPKRAAADTSAPSTVVEQDERGKSGDTATDTKPDADTKSDTKSDTDTKSDAESDTKSDADAKPRTRRSVRGSLRATKLRRRLVKYAILILVVVLAALALRTYVVAPYYIPSQSMEPTLHGCPGCSDDDHVLVDKLSYRFHDPHAGDIVVFDKPPSLNEPDPVLIKRIVAVGGDRLVLKHGLVYVNGRRLSEPYVNKACPKRSSTPETGRSKWLIPNSDVFVMGDNRCDSTDSRTFGPIKDSSIVGRAFVIVWPLKRFTFL